MKLQKKWKDIPKSARAAIVFGICSFLSSGISFLLTPLFTRIMTEQQYGIVVEYNSWHYIIEVFAVLGLASVGSFNVGLNEYRDRRDKYISNMLIMANIATILVFGALVSVKYLFFQQAIIPYRYLLIMCIGFIFSPAVTFYLARKRYEYGYVKGAIVSFGSTACIYGLSILCVLFGDLLFSSDLGESTWKILGAMIGTLIFAVPIYIFLLAKGGIKVDMKMCRNMLVFTLPLLPHYLSMHIMSGADRIMVSRIQSEETAAIYGVASAIGIIASTVWVAINGSLQPFIFNSLNDGNIERVRKVTSSLVLGFSVICFGVCLFAPEILWILAPESYSEGLEAIPPIIGMTFLNALYNVYASIEFYHKKSVGIAVATIAATLLNIVLNAIFIPKFGFRAAAYTSLISNAALTFCHYIGYTRCSGKKIFNNLHLLCISIVCIGASLSCLLIYDMLILRIILAVILGAFLFIKRNMFLSFPLQGKVAAKQPDEV